MVILHLGMTIDLLSEKMLNFTSGNSKIYLWHVQEKQKFFSQNNKKAK